MAFNCIKIHLKSPDVNMVTLIFPGIPFLSMVLVIMGITVQAVWHLVYWCKLLVLQRNGCRIAWETC